MVLATATTLIFLVSMTGITSGAKCPTIVTQENFDVNKYTGLWYEAFRNTIIFELGSKCVNATYTLNADGTVGVLNKATNFLGQPSTITGVARVKNSAEPGALVVDFTNPKQTGDYNVISTDYEQYSIVYSCRDIPVLGKWEFMWLLSRTKTLPDSLVPALKQKLKNMGIDADKLNPTNQNC